MFDGFDVREIELVPIFHLGRSGSTVLVRTLSASSEIISAGEIFNQKVSAPFASDVASVVDRFFSGSYQKFLCHALVRAVESAFWDSFKEAAPRMKRTTVSMCFEYKPNLIGLPFDPVHTEILSSFRSLGIRRAVVIERRSCLARIISQEISSGTGLYHSDQLESSNASFFTKLKFDPLKVVDQGLDFLHTDSLAEIQRLNDFYFATLRAQLRGAGMSVLDVFYEDHILENLEATVSTVATFVGCQISSPPLPALKKTLPIALADLVSNAGEVIEYCILNDVRLVQGQICAPSARS
jgi:hypothetical protein